jgi:(p)ppGpp synthase/HD superfamily hydrolase
MGMHEMREELEDISFQVLYPEAYRVISERLNSLAERNLQLTAEIEQQLSRKLFESGTAAVVTGRRKRAYSVWRKMENKSVGFEQLSDIHGFRVIVKSLPECYQALGIVHTTWPVVPGRFKDYISTPKQNDYRSLHTTVIGPGQQRVELQIRTEAMHEVAEYGIAAHALYKDGVGSPSEMLSRESNAYAWLRRTIESLAEGSNPEEFLEHTKLELFHDQVFCFTPKGKLIALPRKATPIDFAYAVHTDVGNMTVGCKINGRIAPLVSELENGDEVEIITTKAQTAPPAAWESLVVTGKARAAPRYARNMPGSAGALSSACASAPSWNIPTKRCRAPCRGLRGIRSRTCWRRSGAARCGHPTSRARCTRTTRRSVPRALRSLRAKAGGSGCARQNRSCSRCRVTRTRPLPSRSAGSPATCR